MTRAMISVAIMLALVGTGIFSSVWTDKRCDELEAQVRAVSECWYAGNTTKAAAKAAELEHDWKSFRKRASMIIKNGRLAEIDRLTARITRLTADHTDGTGAELSELSELLAALGNSEIPRLRRIL